MTTAAELDALIEELTVDAYNDEEQLSGFLVGAEEALVGGEHATVAGVTVEAMSVEWALTHAWDRRPACCAREQSTRSRSPTSHSPQTAPSEP